MLQFVCSVYCREGSLQIISEQILSHRDVRGSESLIFPVERGTIHQEVIQIVSFAMTDIFTHR